jgi:putative ABC transport system substrate-binding protein
MALAGETKTIPIVFANFFNPVGSGLIASLARPGGNITGFSNFEPAMAGKWLELLNETASSVTRVVAIFDRANALNTEYAEFAQTAERLVDRI